MKYKMILSYDGSNYSGWQVQPNTPTIQEVVEQKLHVLLQEKIKVIGAGRTDAGVHAKGQVAHFSTEKEFFPQKLLYSLNALLPLDIRIIDLYAVFDDFHARYSAIKKTYIYTLLTGNISDPFMRKYCHYVGNTLDVFLLQEGAKYFIGTHNFSSFANQANKGCAKNKPVKTLLELSVEKRSSFIDLVFEGDGFLYKMVRNIVGTLLYVARKKIPAEEIPHILQAQDRQKAPPPAPAHGLTLLKIDYPPHSI